MNYAGWRGLVFDGLIVFCLVSLSFYFWCHNSKSSQVFSLFSLNLFMIEPLRSEPLISLVTQWGEKLSRYDKFCQKLKKVWSLKFHEVWFAAKIKINNLIQLNQTQKILNTNFFYMFLTIAQLLSLFDRIFMTEPFLQKFYFLLPQNS